MCQMAEPEKYGKSYWCLKTPLSPKGEIYVHADEVEFTPSGGVIFCCHREGRRAFQNLAVAAGQWQACFAASVMDGATIAVEHWEGEVVR
jgi:hypothetical protein